MMTRFQTLYDQNHNPHPNRYSFEMSEKPFFVEMQNQGRKEFEIMHHASLLRATAL